MWALMFTYLINNCLNSVSYIFLIVLTGIQGQLKEMQATQKEILSTMKVVRNEIRDLKREWEKRKEEAPETISVPNRIRVHIILNLQLIAKHGILIIFIEIVLALCFSNGV